ncbi:MAG TPA: dihydroorotase [Dehalococcoidia bacterium]|nr:dihydroorotase [Dehalococcoidia bacterium]
MSSLAVRGGRILDPSQGLDVVGDVLIVDGRVAAVGRDAGRDAGEVLDAAGLWVLPGLVDVHCHLREPGLEHKETIETGTMAAARGGFTTVCCMPNTEPPLDTPALVRWVRERAAQAGLVRVLPIACTTRGREGRELADLAELAEAGAVAFSDDGEPVADPALLRRALEYASALGLPLVEHCEDKALSREGVMHEGWVASRLGLRGIPAAAEESAVARALALAAETRGHLHVAHVSTAGAVALLQAYRARGARVTAEVTPHHLCLTHEAVMGTGESPGGLAYDTNAKVNPPLRTRADVEACLEGLAQGAIDCIATDHAPHALEDKLCEFDLAAFGISGLETALALCLSLVHEGRLSPSRLVEALTIAPVRALALDRHVPGLGTLAVGAPGDVTVVDPQREWTVEPERFASKGKNTPLAGRRLRGKVVCTIYGGRKVWQE